MITQNVKYEIQKEMYNRGLRQEDIAETIGVTQKAISLTLNNITVPKSLINLCDALGYDIDIRAVPKEETARRDADIEVLFNMRMKLFQLQEFNGSIPPENREEWNEMNARISELRKDFIKKWGVQPMMYGATI